MVICPVIPSLMQFLLLLLSHPGSTVSPKSPYPQQAERRKSSVLARNGKKRIQGAHLEGPWILLLKIEFLCFICPLPWRRRRIRKPTSLGHCFWGKRAGGVGWVGQVLNWGCSFFDNGICWSEDFMGFPEFDEEKAGWQFCSWEEPRGFPTTG